MKSYIFINFVLIVIVWYFTGVQHKENYERLNTIDSKLMGLASEMKTVKKESIEIKGKVSLIDKSISPKDKRWTLIKKVRKIIQDDVSQTKHKDELNVNDITEMAASMVDYSEQYDVPISLVLAVSKKESLFNPLAVSSANAKGIMQLLDETAEECALELKKPFYNLFKIRDNIQLGTWYLSKMLRLFNGNTSLAIKAYNAGPTFIAKHDAKLEGFLDLPKETLNYHIMILSFLEEYKVMGL